MKNKWNKYPLNYFMEINPAEKLLTAKAKKISMDKLSTTSRSIAGYEFSDVVGGARFRNRDTLLPKITPCLENGKLGFVDILEEGEVAFGSTEFTVLRSNQNSDPYFVYYFAKYPLFRNTAIRLMEGTSGRKRVNEKALSVCEFIIPDLTEQRAIACVLSKLDEKIELNNKINAELEKLAKTIYDFWFIQFNFPNGEGKPYRSYGGEMYYNPILKRNIPIKWQVKNLQNTKLCKIIKPGIKDFKGEKCYYATGDIEGTEIISSGMKITYENRLSRANMQPTINSIWFAKMKNTIKNLLLNEASNYVIDNCILSTGFTGLQCHENTLYYLWEYINGEYFNKKKDSVATGATQQAINETDLSHFHIIEPPDDILLKYTKLVKPYFLMINKNKHQNIELSQLRDFLLPLLMNGQVEIIDEQKTLISDKFDDIRKHWEEQEPFKFAARKDKDKDEDFKEETYDILKALAEE